MKIKVKYLGTRFPKMVNLRNGKKIAFIQGRTELELDEYDALMLLRTNVRIKPTAFIFSIIDVIKDNDQSQILPIEEDVKVADPEPKEEKKKTNKKDKSKSKGK